MATNDDGYIYCVMCETPMVKDRESGRCLLCEAALPPSYAAHYLRVKGDWGKRPA